MIKIKVPATSANLGPGFDCLGMAFGLYNSFIFEESNEFMLEGFDIRYQNDNLALSSYLEVFKYLNIEPIKVKIIMAEQEVPTSRGLGSSATCIVAGVLAAKYFLGEKISTGTCFNIASNIEGHPDNIAPAMFGGLIASFKNDEVYEYVKYDVSKELNFNVLVPNFELSTHEARSVLPTSLTYKDIVYNTARVANIPTAFEKGNISLIIKLLSDKMHEPYRMGLIKQSAEIKKLAHELNCSFCISGAGPSLLIISDYDVSNKFNEYKNWKVYKLPVASDGAILEVI